MPGWPEIESGRVVWNAAPNAYDDPPPAKHHKPPLFQRRGACWHLEKLPNTESLLEPLGCLWHKLHNEVLTCGG
jgi:hypothetical protein